MSRIIGIDFGEKRIGIAISDNLNMLATPVTTVDSKNIYVELNNLVEKHSISLFVIGYPINLDVTNTDATVLVDKFIKRINTYFPKIKIYKMDERYTSKIAKKQIIASGVKKKKRQNKSR